jgi:cellulose synthase/poly-beta-1,6-N-acetylglucosamine synthase-like glycosyltransferase
MRWRSACVATLSAVVAAGPVGYPAWLWRRTRGAAPPEAPGASEPWPAVTALVCAYKEVSTIGGKVADLRANGYPGELEVLVVADDDGTAAAATAAGATVLQPPARQGKAAAINQGVAAALHPIVVLSDANAAIAAGSLAAMVRWFADPAVDGVAGEKQVEAGSAGEGIFWRFESWLKRRETAMGSTIGLVGELAAVRRDRVRPLPIDTAVDDLWLALDILEDGGRIVYEPTAVASEAADWSLRDDWERRTRIVAGMLDVVVRRRPMLRPRGDGVAAQLWGHRILRATAGPAAHVGLVAIACTAARRSWIARTFLAGHGVAAIGLARARRGGDAPAPVRAAGQFLWLELVGLGGTVRYLRGDRPALWPKHER